MYRYNVPGITCRYYITKIMWTRPSRETATFIRLTQRPSGLGIFNCPRWCSNRIRIKIQSGFDRNFLSLFHRSPRTRIVYAYNTHTLTYTHNIRVRAADTGIGCAVFFTDGQLTTTMCSIYTLYRYTSIRRRRRPPSTKKYRVDVPFFFSHLFVHTKRFELHRQSEIKRMAATAARCGSPYISIAAYARIPT